MATKTAKTEISLFDLFVKLVGVFLGTFVVTLLLISAR
jgi:hypothetical protein